MSKSFGSDGVSSAEKADGPRLGVAVSFRVTDSSLVVRLSNGREVRRALSEYPRLLKATPAQRRNARIEAFGTAIHWPDIDEDIGVSQILGVSEEELYKVAGFTVHPSGAR